MVSGKFREVSDMLDVLFVFSAVFLPDSFIARWCSFA